MRRHFIGPLQPVSEQADCNITNVHLAAKYFAEAVKLYRTLLSGLIHWTLGSPTDPGIDRRGCRAERNDRFFLCPNPPARPETHKEVLTFLRRPAIGFGAGAAHQHGPLGVAQAVGLQEGLDGLLVIDDGERARPIRAPQAAIETPGIEDAG